MLYFRDKLAEFIWEVKEVYTENIRLRKQLEKKQKVIRYYRKEKKRLTNIVDKLHADCYYYENHRMPQPWEDQPESSDFPF